MVTLIVNKWGNSLGIRLPRNVADIVGFREGSHLEVKAEPQKMIIVISEKKDTLDDLINRITPENRHDYIDTAPEVGREQWEW